jgi:sugar/nucleoside kinase (ribokinase family)
MMKRPNVFYILGNHDAVVLTLIRDIAKVVVLGNTENLLAENLRSYRDWLEDGGGVTLQQFISLSVQEQEDLLIYLEEAASYEMLEEKGDEIFAKADSVVLQADINRDVVKKVFALARKYDKKVYSVVSNMSIVASRREFLQEVDCFICNQQEAGLLFLDDYSARSPEEMGAILAEKVRQIGMSAMVVTMGGQGAVYADRNGLQGFCPARSVLVKDTTGAGDAFCAGVASGLTYGKSLPEAVELGTYLAAAVITSLENVCPRFRPEELGLCFQSDRA